MSAGTRRLPAARSAPPAPRPAPAPATARRRGAPGPQPYPGKSSATYVVFDLLYHRGRCLLHEPLARRRAELAALCAGLELPAVVFSAGVVGAGTAWYALALAHGHEGVVAKRLSSTYRPGRRSPAWRKIKPRGRAHRSEGLPPGCSARDM
jgi:ATP-dependent DNA ligase